MTDTSDPAGAAATAAVTAYGRGTADASGLWLVIHRHKHGDDHLVIRADHEPTEDEVLALRIIDFEPDRDEELRILSLEADRVLTLGTGSSGTLPAAPSELARMFTVATDGESAVLDDLAQRAGIIWRCACGWNNDESATSCAECKEGRQ